MKIGLIPLDERPVNTRYPHMLADIAACELILPPTECLSHFRSPADSIQLMDWLRHTAPQLDALIVSVEMLGYGGLIPSRISHDPLETILGRLEVLREIKRPDLTLYGFNVITRISRHDDATEEPLYWAEYGNRLFRLSQLLDRAQQGQDVQNDLIALQDQIPAKYRHDFEARRARNHHVNKAVLDLLKAEVLDLLVLSSDDTSEYGLGSAEKRYLQAYAQELHLGENLLMYPGADEVGCVLLARLLNQQASLQPAFYPIYIVPEGKNTVAPFEDAPIHVTVERQIHAAGGIISTEDAPCWLFINPPVDPPAEWVGDYPNPNDSQARLPYFHQALEQIALGLKNGKQIAIADVAYANGASDVLFKLLTPSLAHFTAFAAWNTAGNTLGTVIAQACLAQYIHTEAQAEAQRRFLLHRYLEDWAYQTILRGAVRDWLKAFLEEHDPTPNALMDTLDWLTLHLNAILKKIPPFEAEYQVTKVNLPWERTFEVDFELEKR